MSRLFDAYRAFHEQGFIPIFVDDDFDSRMLLEACIDAGLKGIEYTLRRRDAHTMIPWIRENYPDLYVLVGSTIDDDRVLAHCRKRFPQLLTVSELDLMGVDGFVSMMSWHEESIRKYSPTRIVIPSAYTVNEAYSQVRAGAHFAKITGDVELVRACRKRPTFDYCPILITGQMTSQRIPEAVDAGAVVIGSGFDLILKGQPTNISTSKAAELIRVYADAASEARARRWPEMARAMGGDADAWLDSLPHYHPFQ